MLEDGSDVQISPSWSKTVQLLVGDSSVPMTVKEIETETELEAFLRLTRYHYRGAKGAGRTVPLIVTADQHDLPKVLGFIELTTSFLVNSARKRILDAQFSDKDSGVAWARWDSQTAKKWINCIARISRCVVFPELRGLGLSSLLVESAVQFARSRWHVGGMRPIFLEITADMLRYWPFVEKAGFIYIGETEGNEHRAAKDMNYLIRKATESTDSGTGGMPKGGGGILSLQRSRAEHLRRVVQRTGLSLEQVINQLKVSPDKLSDDDWFLLHNVYRRPKPTYLRGLTDAAHNFVTMRSSISSKGRTAPSNPVNGPRSNKGQSLQISGLTISVHTKPVSSNRSRRLQEAFGIVSKVVELPILEDLQFTLPPSQIVLVTGPSGSGKSLLLEAIRRLANGYESAENDSEIQVKGDIEGERPRIGVPMQCDPSLAPIDALHWLTMEEALRVMAVSGLAEPQVLIRPSRTLSLGQKYRLSLALGIAQAVDVLVVDEFCESLDRFSATAVSRHLRREIDLRGMSAIVATSRPDALLSSLKPDRILTLSSDGNFVWN